VEGGLFQDWSHQGVVGGVWRPLPVIGGLADSEEVSQCRGSVEGGAGESSPAEGPSHGFTNEHVHLTDHATCDGQFRLAARPARLIL
jgi:hypothetical protein